MMEINRHIEILLLSHDCVIVPGLGGFMAHHQNARYDESDHMFVPPLRTLGFNAQLSMSDPLLAQSYADAYDISYPEAVGRVESDVQHIKQELERNGSYEFTDIGTLRLTESGTYDFEPCEAGILSPAYYGLDACSFVTLKEARGMNAANVALQASTEPVELPQPTSSDSPALLDFADNGEPEEEHVIRIKMSWVRNIAAIAAAVIAFFVMATPIANSDLRTRAMSDLKGNLLYKLIPQLIESHCSVIRYGDRHHSSAICTIRSKRMLNLCLLPVGELYLISLECIDECLVIFLAFDLCACFYYRPCNILEDAHHCLIVNVILGLHVGKCLDKPVGKLVDIVGASVFLAQLVCNLTDLTFVNLGILESFHAFPENIDSLCIFSCAIVIKI